MSFAPDPDSGDFEASIGVWAADPDVSTVTRDTTLARSGVASLRVTNTATATVLVDTRTIAVISPTLAVVATDPAPGGVGSVTVSGWYYLQDPTFDVVGLVFDVLDADLNVLGTASAAHGAGRDVLATHDAWTQISGTVDGLDPAQVAFFDLAAIGGREADPQIPPGAFMRWDDFDFVGALAVAAPSGWVVG